MNASRNAAGTEAVASVVDGASAMVTVVTSMRDANLTRFESACVGLHKYARPIRPMIIKHDRSGRRSRNEESVGAGRYQSPRFDGHSPIGDWCNEHIN